MVTRRAHHAVRPGDPARPGLPPVAGRVPRARRHLRPITRQGFDYYTGAVRAGLPVRQVRPGVRARFSAGAMENVGCVTITERLLFRSKVTDTMYELRAMVILHEMAHMWFGDLVTMKWWDDLWLNESFAEMLRGPVQRRGDQVHRRLDDVLRRPQDVGLPARTSCRPPIRSRPTCRRSSEAIANFDGISYAKGASVLKQLVAYVGRDNFFAGIRAYLTEHGWGNATLADLLARAGDQLGPEPGRLVEGVAADSRAEHAAQRVHRPTGRGVHRRSRSLQEAPPEHPTLRPHHIAIGLYNRDGGGDLVRTHRVEVDVAGARTEVPGADRPAAAGPDPAQRRRPRLRDRSRFDERSLATLTTSIGAVPRLARADRLLERGDGHGPAGASCRCRPSSTIAGRAAWARSRRSRCCRRCTG